MTDETKNDGGPAFPLIWNSAHNSEWNTEAGMTLRDWFAGQALAGLLAGQFRDTGSFNLSEVPREAYDMADVMLAERSR